MTEKIRLWLDDDEKTPARQAPEGWVWVKTAHEAIEILKTGNVIEVSLDHDLGDEDLVGNGHMVSDFIEESAFHGTLKPLKWAIHSENWVERPRMTRALQNADRFWSR